MGHPPKTIEAMLRMYLMQSWFNLSDAGIEDAIYDSYAMRSFMHLDFLADQVPDATALLHFRHLKENRIGETMPVSCEILFILDAVLKVILDVYYAFPIVGSIAIKSVIVVIDRYPAKGLHKRMKALQFQHIKAAAPVSQKFSQSACIFSLPSPTLYT